LFFTFLNKEESKYLDLSVYMKYSPRELLYYYYGRSIYISPKLYEQIQDWAQSEESYSGTLQQWLKIINEEIELGHDLFILQENPYINILGPYYYLPTNTSFYFTAQEDTELERITAADIEQLNSFMAVPAVNKELERYQRNRKNLKKNPRNREDLLRDIKNCQLALKEIEKLSRHINFLNKLQNQASQYLNEEGFAPEKPLFNEKKPDKYQTSSSQLNKIIPFAHKLRKARPNINDNFQQELKEYYIKYREYEKACDRYKSALSRWPDYYAQIKEFWQENLAVIERKKQQALKNMHIYNEILTKSYIHNKYQDYNILKTFEDYLDTGRAVSLQDCMNLYEEEKRWEEVKLSQERIENSIHFIQSETENMIYAEQELNDLMHRSLIKKVIS